ncbi:MAG: SCO family protein [Sphingobium sp.]|nr:SCO family protein [Sphingobium sp.]
MIIDATSSVARRDLVFGGLAALVSTGVAQDAVAQQRRALRVPVRLTEMMVRDTRAGRQLRLIRDIMSQRVVALTFFFTGCSTVCPIQSMALSRAQPLLQPLLGPRAVFVSISLDWFGDTPKAIESFAQAHHAGPHWRFLKAPLGAVDNLRRGFESYDPQRDNHPPVIAIGRAGAPNWSRLYGNPRPTDIATEVRAWAA